MNPLQQERETDRYQAGRSNEEVVPVSHGVFNILWRVVEVTQESQQIFQLNI